MDLFKPDADNPGFAQYSSEVGLPISHKTYLAFFERVHAACLEQSVALGEGHIRELPIPQEEETAVLYLYAPVESGEVLATVY